MADSNEILLGIALPGRMPVGPDTIVACPDLFLVVCRLTVRTGDFTGLRL